PPADDQAIRRLVALPRLHPEGGLAPGRPGRRHPDGRLALATAVRVIDGVHGEAALAWPPAQPPLPTGLPNDLVLMLHIADLTDGGPALPVDHPHLARGETEGRVGLLLGHQLRAGPGRRASWPPLPMWSSTL